MERVDKFFVGCEGGLIFLLGINFVNGINNDNNSYFYNYIIFLYFKFNILRYVVN